MVVSCQLFVQLDAMAGEGVGLGELVTAEAVLAEAVSVTLLDVAVAVGDGWGLGDL
jgi:hypothetical protein